jgi:hypothetical protein
MNTKRERTKDIACHDDICRHGRCGRKHADRKRRISPEGGATLWPNRRAGHNNLFLFLGTHNMIYTIRTQNNSFALRMPFHR